MTVRRGSTVLDYINHIRQTPLAGTCIWKLGKLHSLHFASVYSNVNCINEVNI